MAEELSFIDGFLMDRFEDSRFEAKRAEDKLPNSLWATYSAFANTYGGTIVLGLSEAEGRLVVTGVRDPRKLVKDFWDGVNSKEKVSANILSDESINIQNVCGKDIVVIHVPRASRKDLPIYIGKDMYTGTYMRLGEGMFTVLSVRSGAWSVNLQSLTSIPAYWRGMRCRVSIRGVLGSTGA